jgi:lipoic acid synthetase
MTVTETKRPRLPEWLRIKLPTSDSFAQTRNLLGELKLHTVCASAQCPNHWECWAKGTATFMIAGDRCTRACGFCAVSTAKPLALEADEPLRVAEAARRHHRRGPRRYCGRRRRTFSPDD